MEVKSQLNISDRTLLSGVPYYDSIPEFVSFNGKRYKVIGISYGITPPFISLEIAKTEDKLTNKTIRNQ